MGMVDQGSCWDGVVANGVAGDDDFENILSILDFPMESLEGDDALIGDWDSSQSDYLGPIPSDVLMGPPMPHGKISNGPPHLLSDPAPTSKSRQSKERRRLSHQAASIESMKDGAQRAEHLVPIKEEMTRNSSSQRPTFTRKCTHCEVTMTPQWREGPLGPKTLCNACGVRYKSGRLFPQYRPAASPTFIPSVHSNSHREVVEKMKDASRRAKNLYQVPINEEMMQTGSLQRPVSMNNCTHCELTETPKRREGPLGPRTLCNACGVQYRSGNLIPEYRPAAGVSIHSNFQNNETEMMKSASQRAENLYQVPVNEEMMQTSSSQRPACTNKCTNCEATETPQWREGPLGPRTLCNACGIRHRSGRLFPEYQPVVSPTSIPSIHSNSVEVVGMCKKAKQPQATKFEIDGKHEQKQLADLVEEAIGPVIPQNTLNGAQDSIVFQTQSPVSVLESSGSCLAGKRLPIKYDVAIPVRARSKRVRPSGVNPWMLVSPLFATTSGVNSKRRRRRSSKLDASIETTKDVSGMAENIYQMPTNEEMTQTGSPSLPAITKKCTHCEVTKTPQWREGPLGPKTLCNACGVRYRSGRLFPEYRPAASPTFVPSVHSNSHKKVIEMRSKSKQQQAANVEVPPMSPQPEFIPMNRYLFDNVF